MTDAKLLKSWKITTTLLERARLALPAPSDQEETGRAARVAQYHHFLEHNEWELALNTLEELGHLVACRAGSGAIWKEQPRTWVSQKGCRPYASPSRMLLSSGIPARDQATVFTQPRSSPDLRRGFKAATHPTLTLTPLRSPS
jgi:hypothetical protein